MKQRFFPWIVGVLAPGRRFYFICSGSRLIFPDLTRLSITTRMVSDYTRCPKRQIRVNSKAISLSARDESLFWQ